MTIDARLREECLLAPARVGGFDRWLESEQKPAAEEPDAGAGRSVFLAQSCVNCHRVRERVPAANAARGNYAPDLTHLMGRQTLASGMVPNTPDNLRRWVADPQQIKPGCLMPAFGLGDRERDDIVRYLETLR